MLNNSVLNQFYDCFIGKWKNLPYSSVRSILKLVNTALIVLFAYLIVDLIEDATVEGKGWITILPQLTNFSKVMVSGVVQTISGSGYYGIFALMFLESISLPIPSEVILPFSGYLVSRGLLDFWRVLAFTTLAGVGGAIVDYVIGYYLARRESLTLGKYTLVQMDQFKLVGNWFRKHGWIAVFLARMVPGFRTLISFPAGMSKMSIVKFTVSTAAGCFIWNATLIYSGLFLTDNWHRIVVSENYLTIITTIVLTVLLAWFLFKRRMKKNQDTGQEYDHENRVYPMAGFSLPPF
jgi:membrane protein DedA with SNARE-associated domain